MSVEIVHSGELSTAAAVFAQSPVFDGTTCWFPANPWQRPVRRQDLAGENIAEFLSEETLCTNRSLVVHRLLFNIYEQDLLFLPERMLSEKCLGDFRAFYDPTLVGHGRSLKPLLERVAFSVLESSNHIPPITIGSEFEVYVLSVIDGQESQGSKLCESLLSSCDPKSAFRMLLVQQASDFLSEASAMGRSLLGNFGKVQSALMKAFIDEYGKGIHSQKHSTLFEKALDSVGLSSEAHYYYNFYLPTSLMLVNYFHYVCGNKWLWFRYLGALYYAEASIPHYNHLISDGLRKVFGGKANSKYFDEHVHIDKYHRTMVLDRMIKPSLETYGDVIVPDLLIGFETFRRLQKYADRDLMEQVRFAQRLRVGMVDETDRLLAESDNRPDYSKSMVFDEARIRDVGPVNR